MAEIQVVTTKIEVDDSEIVKLIKTLSKTEEGAKGVEDAFKEAGTSMKEVVKAAELLGTKAGGSFKSLKTQIRDAKEQAQILSQKFGENSAAALKAQKSVALLVEELDDFNGRVKALNPEAKFNAVNQVLGGTLGALQGVTGALQLFGAESEALTKLAQKLQGAFNLAQGINSVLGMKDAFKNLQTVLGITTVAQKGLAAANVAEAGSANIATASTNRFTAALLANPVTAIAVAIAALVAGIIIYNNVTEETNELTEKQIQLNDDLAKSYQEIHKGIVDQINVQIIKTKVAAGELTALQGKLQQNELDRAAAFEKLSDDYIRKNEELVKAGEEARFFITDSDTAKINLLYNLREKEINLSEKIIEKKKDQKKVEESLIASMKLLGLEAVKTHEEILALSDDGFVKLKDTLAIISANAFEVRDAILGITNELKNLQPIAAQVAVTGSDLNKAMFEKNDAKIEENWQYTVDVAQRAFETINQFRNQERDRDLIGLEEQLKNKVITQEQYDKEVSKLRRRQALQDQATAIFRITVDTAMMIAKILSQTGIAAPPFIAAYSALAAAQMALVLSAPLPKFAKGQLPGLSDPYTSQDNTLAMVGSSEAIIPADKTKAFYPTLSAIYKGHISPKMINQFVMNQGKTKGSAIDLLPLMGAVRNNKGVKVENANQLGKIIATEINKAYSRRRIV